MILVPVGLAAGLFAVVLTGGRLRRVLDLHLRAWPLVVASAVLLAILRRSSPPGAPVLLVLALAMSLTFVVANLRFRCMPVVFTGLAMNALCVVVNQGMPVRLPSDATTADFAAYADSSSHHVERDDDRLTRLGDVLLIPWPERVPVSYGDLVLVAGLIGVLFRVGRPPGRHAGAPYQRPTGGHRARPLDRRPTRRVAGSSTA